jgi:glycosyltransferase involved in cell wall biosynthesis
MTDMPLVSAVMPVFNGEEFLVAALDSLLAQDYETFEVVVCDDGSTDGTAEILRSYPQVSTVRQENRGAAAARNAAIAASRGELVATFDADDTWPANRLSLQAAFLAEHPEIGCVMGRQEWINPPPWLGRDDVFGDLDGIPLLSAMFRRDALDQAGGFDETFTHSEDMDLLVRLRERGVGIAVLPEIILHRRFHGANLTASAPDTQPLLRSLRQKLERARVAEGDGGDAPS